jgi:hypothetical protein
MAAAAACMILAARRLGGARTGLLAGLVFAWAILAEAGLARLDVRVATAVVVPLAVLGAGDQQVIRSAGGHNWAYYPLSTGVTYPDYAGAAAIIAREERAGDGVVYPGTATSCSSPGQPPSCTTCTRSSATGPSHAWAVTAGPGTWSAAIPEIPSRT